MNVEEKNQMYKLFLKSFLKIKTSNIKDSNLISFDLFVSTTRVYKFTTLKWSKAIKDQAEKCQDLLLTKICDTFKDCNSITVAAEASLIDGIFKKFSENSENLKILDNFINFSIDDLNIKKARLNLSKKDNEIYQHALKRIDRLNLFHFEEKISEEQSKNYQQSRTNSKSSLTVAESEFESIFSFSDL